MTRTMSNRDTILGPNVHAMGTTQGSELVDPDNLQSARSDGPTVHGVNTERMHSRYVRSSSQARAKAKSGGLSPRTGATRLGSPTSPGPRQIFS